MSAKLDRRDRRELKRSVVVDAVLTTNARVGRLEGFVLKRSFWGRLTWLLTGR